MTDPRLKDIADVLLSRIAAITTGGGYNFDAGETGFGAKSPDLVSEPQNPACFVHSLALEDRETFELSTASTDAMMARASVVLRLYVFGTDRITDLMLWARDIAAAVEADVDLALGYVLAARVSSFEPAVTDLASSPGYLQGNMTVAVEYTMALGEI